MKVIFLIDSSTTSFTYSEQVKKIKSELFGIVRELKLDPEVVCFSKDGRFTKDNQPFELQGDVALVIYWTGIWGATRKDVRNIPKEFFSKHPINGINTIYMHAREQQNFVQKDATHDNYPTYELGLSTADKDNAIHGTHKEQLKEIMIGLLPEKAKNTAGISMKTKREPSSAEESLVGVPPVVIGLIAAAATGIVATEVIVPLELTGTTAIFSTPWMFEDMALQDSVVAVGALVLLAVIAAIAAAAGKKLSSP